MHATLAVAPVCPASGRIQRPQPGWPAHRPPSGPEPVMGIEPPHRDNPEDSEPEMEPISLRVEANHISQPWVTQRVLTPPRPQDSTSPHSGRLRVQAQQR